MDEKIKEILSSTQSVSLFKYEPEKNPSASYTKLIPKLLFRIDQKEEINQVENLLEIHSVANGSLRTMGDYYFELELTNNKKYIIEYLHGGRLRSEKIWASDAILKKPMELLNWFSKRGVNQPLELELKRKEKIRKENEKNRIISLKIPRGLINENGTLDTSCLKESSKEVYHKIVEKESNENILILNLFELLVLRSDNWWEVSILEMVIIKVLMGAPLESINEIIETNKLTSLQADGVARFFTSTEFQKMYNKKELHLPQSVKEKVYVFIEKMGNEKKIRFYESKILNNK